MRRLLVEIVIVGAVVALAWERPLNSYFGDEETSEFEPVEEAKPEEPVAPPPTEGAPPTPSETPAPTSEKPGGWMWEKTESPLDLQPKK